MQTFLPYADLEKSAQCLDYRRLGKQRVEAWQILNIITRGHSGYGKTGWNNHPVVHMWTGYPMCLAAYMNYCIKEWIHRGYNNTMKIACVQELFEYPEWFGDDRFHASHRANLLRKDQGWYGQFGWTESPDLPYFWPRT